MAEQFLGRYCVAGKGVRAGPGVIVGVHGQWIRLRPGIRPPPAQQHCLEPPSVPSQPTPLPTWPPHRPERPFCKGRTPEETEPLPDAATVAPDHRELQWGTPPAKYDSRESEDLQFGCELEPLPAPDQSGLFLQQPELPPSGLDPVMPGSTKPVKTTTRPLGNCPTITVTLSTGGAQQGTSDVLYEESGFLNDTPFPG